MAEHNDNERYEVLILLSAIICDLNTGRYTDVTMKAVRLQECVVEYYDDLSKSNEPNCKKIDSIVMAITTLEHGVLNSIKHNWSNNSELEMLKKTRKKIDILYDKLLPNIDRKKITEMLE